MAKTSIENLKARFKRGMYPTEGDFANVFDSYVHKDDGIDINDVTADNGSKTLTTLLQEFKQEILQDAKDQQEQYDDTELKGKVEANEGNISSLESRVSTNEGDISSLEGRVLTNEGDISTLKDDLDTAEDFIAGHETRIQALEERAEVPEGLAEFIVKVNSFLEDSDATDSTINKWKEIEAFLSGITDTETLTGLLADLKEEILGEIPEQKEYTAGDGIDISEDGVISLKEDEKKLDCLKVIADLDASNAPTGTIAIYSGATNDKYTHGFIYEKKEGEDGGGVPIAFSWDKFDGGRELVLSTPVEYCTELSASRRCTGMFYKYKDVYGSVYFCGIDEGSGSFLIWSNQYTSFWFANVNDINFKHSQAWTPLNVMNVIN